jgi:hypothetical protein
MKGRLMSVLVVLLSSHLACTSEANSRCKYDVNMLSHALEAAGGAVQITLGLHKCSHATAATADSRL